MRELNIYQRNGYYNREDYLRCMSEDYCVPYDVVHAMADKLGRDEEFDGLVEAVKNYEGGDGERCLRVSLKTDPYRSRGYIDRTEYLQDMSMKHRIPLSYVEKFSDILGASRDFDGLDRLLSLIGELI
ncbi:MAG: hypothetical protein Q4B77_03600 [Coriobacteriaceae bacterium]|nr:hypothetical protein [Coriobacteriaceae bacterium]